MREVKNLKEAVYDINPCFDGMEKYFEATIEKPVIGASGVISVFDENSFASFCHSQMSGGIGMKIRNRYEFWFDKKTPLYQDLKNNHHCSDPDSMSDKIIRGVYQLRNQQKA